MATPAAFAALLGDEAASERDLRAAADLFRRLDCGTRAEVLEQRLASSAPRST